MTRNFETLKNHALVKIEDSFWSPRQQLVRDVVLPYQWQALNDLVPDAAPSHSIRNLKIAAGDESGSYYGPVFQDSDLYKWLEAVGYTLLQARDVKLEKWADQAIDLLARAQWDDGYLNSYFTVAKPDRRWTNLRDDHELYCAGHLIEAAVAYYEATGKDKILHIVCRLADHIATIFGPNEGQKRGYPGHSEIELALVKLYRVTHNRHYLELSKFFIDERGKQPHYFELEAIARNEQRARPYNLDYSQSHIPVRDQETVEGHAVRAMYLFSGVVDVALEYGDQELLESCRQQWNNVVRKRMYVTGGVGSSAYQEAFTTDYDLPNDSAYTETCAAIGLVFWAQRMQCVEQNGSYADTMERALYNGVLSGMALDGKSYFYVNPLSVQPRVVEHRHDLGHVKYVRQPWFGCACCPPNLARLIASIGQYVSSINQQTRELFLHLYISSQINASMGRENFELSLQTNYPWDGKTTCTVMTDATCTLALRIPGWCRDAQLMVNEEVINIQEHLEHGYVKIRRSWHQGDRIVLQLGMAVELVRANPTLQETVGKVALQRGPLIYCLEEKDNGENLSALQLSLNSTLSSHMENGLLGGVYVIDAQGYRTTEWGMEEPLYQSKELAISPILLRAVPYYAWANRGAGEMQVWVRECVENQ